MSIATIEVNLSALLHNVAFFRERCPSTQIMAIIKANAYSHGRDKIAEVLDGRVDYFGGARLDEAIALRNLGVKSPILLLEGFFPHDNLQDVIDYNLQTVIHCPEQIERLQALPDTAAKLTVWFKLDSGMHRIGFRPQEAKYYFEQLAQCKVVRKPINVMSHFSSADVLTSDQTLKQMTLFDRFVDSIDDCTLIGKQSIAASGGILAWPASYRDIIRPGIALYGVSPFSYETKDKATGEQIGLQPVMTLKSELITVRKHKKGEAVGYGLIWQSQEDTLLGVVALGYGDGYPREVLAGTPVWINDRIVPIVGRVAMDMILVDLGHKGQDKAGDDVIFWGNHELPVEKIAAHSNMSPYELVTRLTSRAKFHYIN